jgi:hypothetical protein
MFLVCILAFYFLSNVYVNFQTCWEFIFTTVILQVSFKKRCCNQSVNGAKIISNKYIFCRSVPLTKSIILSSLVSLKLSEDK